ncbi:DUF481 domain-containing protein [Pontibacter sp. 13R65]|uniref:DUF481 domain-containing protein n=1 Tax=Pontibacter sp. 13R65 TaxID=3127458 RepID=UPI00301C6143
MNIERARLQRDSANYFTGSAGLNFSMYNRNAGRDNPNNFLQLTFTGDIGYFSRRHAYMLLNNYDYILVNFSSRETRNTVASNGFTHFRINLHRKQKLSYELFVQLQNDQARGLDLRTLSGAGVRIALLRNDAVQLYAGTGLMHEHETWKDPDRDGVFQTSDLLKSTNYTSIRAKLNDLVSTSAIVYYQTGYDKAISRLRNRLSGDVGFDVKIYGKLSLRTNFNFTFEDEPIVPVTKFIYSINNGFKYEFQ